MRNGFDLMKEKTGYTCSPVQGEEPWKCKAFKGELVVQIPREEMRQIKGVIPNFRLYRDPEVMLHADPIEVSPLEEREIEYLLAVQPAAARLREYLCEEDKKMMKIDLMVGDKVIFKLEIAPRTPTSSVNGTIRYIGPHPDSDGIVFGIEIQDQAYCGKGTSNGRPYFDCGTNNAVYVAMDKIIKQDTCTFILMQDETGFHFTVDGGVPWQCKVPKGELLVELQIRQIESDKPPPNYRLYRDDEYIVLHVRRYSVCPLGDKVLEYLLAVEPPNKRLQEYLKLEEVKEKLDLVVGDVVLFKMKVKPDAAAPSIVKGIIRYIGPIQRKRGTHFGIEIQEQRYHGKGTSNGNPYFCCGSKDAVFVSMEKITRKAQYRIDGKKSATTAAKNAVSHEPTKRNLTGTPDIKRKAEAIEQGTRTDPDHQSKFKIDDRVVVKSVKDEVFHGTVKWVGTTRVYNEGDRKLSTVAVVGVDVEKAFLSTDKHFPGMCLDITGSRGQEVFKVPLSHTRLFLPEEYGVVLHVEEYAKQQQEANALKWEMDEADKFDLNLEEYRSQKEYLEKAKLANKDMEQERAHHPQQTGGRIKEEGAAAGVGALSQNNKNEKDKMSESIMMHIESGAPLGEERRLQQEERAYELARQHCDSDQTEHKDIKGLEVKPVDNNYLNVDIPECQQDVNPVPEGLQKPSLKVNREEGYKSLSSSNTPHQRSPDPPPAGYHPGQFRDYDYSNRPRDHGRNDLHDPPCNPDHHSDFEHHCDFPHNFHVPPPDPGNPPGPPPDPHYDQFTIGSMVRIDVQKGDPLCGVLKWIGTVPGYPGTIAGVELDRPLHGCADGTWRGKKFFTCPYGKGYFCPLDTLKQDTRYMDEGQVPAHMRQDIDNRSHKEEIIKLKEEIHQLQTSIDNLQFENNTQQRRAKQEAEREKEQWKNEKQQLLGEQERLREEVKKKLETEKERLREENDHLKYENEHLRRNITDLREAHGELQQETEKKEQVQAQLQSQVGLFSIENMRLKGQVKQLEESSATDIKYWEVSYKQVLTNKDTLGSGGWGKVEVGLLHGQKVAVKMLHSDIKSPYYNQLVRREISMLAKVRHPNLLLFIAGVLDHPSGSPIIITELLDTSLRKAYTDRLIGSDRVRISIMRDVAAALNYIHCQKESIIHRDVSSANVLLESRGEGNWKAKLSDFGSANLVQFSTTVGPGAIPYAAPEVPHNQTTKMDVYSYGVLLCEVILSEFPFKERFPDMLQSLAGSWSLMHQLILSCTRHSVAGRVDMMYVLDTFNESFTDVSVKGFVPLV